ncbi:hypothetical protein Forpe1208_v014472 [Fusarium oxysporum f. sp. rapae]|uniref:Uncharacterized protein n=1 Tax=Fusarium oxysporum f. sp. rapae TaxID=485398 RepID=A0A8J5TQC6_FUSOX|nr:hypothetical protein Forpe1208_v014472 [Fusarium oxysporum f. sp. rapae]
MQSREKEREKTTDELESATYATAAYLQPDQARLALWQNDFQGHLGLIGSSFGPSGLQASVQARALEWIHVFDSGASSHIFCRHKNFTVLQSTTDSRSTALRTQKSHQEDVERTASACKGLSGHITLPLIALSLEKKGVEVIFRNGKAVVTNKGKAILTATRISGVYVVDEAEEDHF